MRHRFAVTNWLTAAYRTVQLIARQVGAPRRHPAAQGLHRRGRRDRHHRPVQPRPGHGRDRPLRRRDRVVRPGLRDPAADQRPRSAWSCSIGVPAADAADRPAARAAAAPRRHPARADGRPVQHRHRHRQRPAGAARHRRRAGLPRPLPPRVADHPPGRRSRSPGCSRCSTRCRSSCPASSWWSSSGSAPATPSPARISAGELVAFYGYAAFLMIPLRTATEYANKLIRGRVAARRVCRVLALDPDLAERRRPRAVARRRRRAGRRPHRAARRARPAHRDRLRAARRVGGAGRPARPADRHPGRRGPARRRAAHRAAARRGAPPDRGLRHRRRRCSSGRLDDRLDDPRRRRGGDGPRPAHRAAPRTSSTRSTAAWTRGRPRRAARSPAASGSGWCWPARCSTDPEILVLVEPTSAVDAHTEARIAARLRDAPRRPDHRGHHRPAR